MLESTFPRTPPTAKILPILTRRGLLPEGRRFGRIAQDAAPGQRVDEDAAVPLAGHARVEHRDDAAVGRAADEAAEALLEGERGLWDLVAKERILALGPHPVDAGRHQRLAGRREGQLVDH